jgi:hypothetical protein
LTCVLVVSFATGERVKVGSFEVNVVGAYQGEEGREEREGQRSFANRKRALQER